MTVTLRRTIERPDAGAEEGPVESRVWCTAVLPNGALGHWFPVAAAMPVLCHDPACALHGYVAYQCPLHRGFVGSIDAAPPKDPADGTARIA
jgi:hypothetical protein